jgi:3-oxoacyl-[acyl-carrier-protein] synthase III
VNREAYIVGTGRCVPEKILTNADLEKMVDTSDQWIRERTGIRTRHITDSSTATSDLAVEAVSLAMKAAGWAPSDVQGMIVATVTPDYPFPATACLVADRLGMNRIPAWDFEAGCSGFVYGLIQARAFVASGLFDRMIVIGAECLTKITNWEDRTSCILFGDGAGAVAISSTGPGGRLGGFHWGSDGAMRDLLVQPAGGSREPASCETVQAHKHTIWMNGSETFRHAVRAMKESCLNALEMEGISKDKVDLLISHQANWRIIDATARSLDLKPDQVYVNIDRYGNTSSASIPLALDEAIEKGIISAPKTVVVAAFGAGMTWGGMVLRWQV